MIIRCVGFTVRDKCNKIVVINFFFAIREFFEANKDILELVIPKVVAKIL